MIGVLTKNGIDMLEQINSPLDKKELQPILELPNSPEKADIAFIECTTRSALIEQNAVVSPEKGGLQSEGIPAKDIAEDEGLSDEEKAKIKEKTDWPDKIIENIQNMKQYELLKTSGLKEVEINGRTRLVKENINLACADADGISNRDRMARGLAPLDSKTGKPLELHHLGQRADSPLVELTEKEHRTGEFEDGKKNQSLWHDNTIGTEVHGEGNTWDQERKAHWKAREEQISGGNH